MVLKKSLQCSRCMLDIERRRKNAVPAITVKSNPHDVAITVTELKKNFDKFGCRVK